MTSARAKEVTALARDLRRHGYTVESTKAGHFKVRMTPERRDLLAASGFPVHSAPAFVVLPRTASDHRALRNAQAMLRRIGYPLDRCQ